MKRLNMNTRNIVLKDRDFIYKLPLVFFVPFCVRHSLQFCIDINLMAFKSCFCLRMEVALHSAVKFTNFRNMYFIVFYHFLNAYKFNNIYKEV